jgi:very-short-patch-repair endonuclease
VGGCPTWLNPVPENRRDLQPSEVARRQEGVIHRSQLHELGFNDRQIGIRRRAGLLHEIFPDVWALGHSNISPLGYLVAALLSCGPRSFLSHRTAAAVHGLRVINTRAIELTYVGTNPPRRGPLVLHRTRCDPHPDELRTRSPGLRFSSVPRLLVELAPREDPRELDRLITQAVRRRLYDPQAVEAALARHARRPGIARLAAAVAAYRPRPDRASELERAFDEWLRAHPEIPEPLRNVEIDGWEIDCWWPGPRVALELDGRPYHVAVRDMERDRLKDAKLQLQGVRPLRITDARWEHDRAGAVGDLIGLLGL